jgi:NitT/TauT family transport system permease protein
MSAKTIGVRPVLIPLATLAVFLGLWQIGIPLFQVNPIILPQPTAIAQAAAANWQRLLTETCVTMYESVAGFLIGCGIAYLLAIAFVHSKLIQEALYPYAIALKSTPLIAIAPLLVLWFGNGLSSKIVMAALVAFFPVLVNSVTGLGAVEPEALDLMRSLSASPLQILLKVRIPNSLPYLMASLKIASSLAVVGAVIGEFTGATRGIGFLINTSSYYLNTALMFAGVLIISLAGIVFFGLVAYVEKRLVFWTEQS